MLHRLNIALLCALLTLTALPAAATTTITPDKVGTYVGTMTQKDYHYGTGEVTTTKQAITIVLNADDTFQVTTPQSILSTGTGTFGANNGVLPLAQTGGIITFTLHFKGTKVKGLFQQYLKNTGLYFSEGKFSATKQ